MTLCWLCFTVPLLAVPLPDWVKLLVAIVFSNWLQAWALPVLQISQNAKSTADHAALVHIATTVDEIKAAQLASE